MIDWIGTQLESVTTSKRFIDATVTLQQIRNAADKAREEATGALLHVAGLPALGDVRRLNRQIAVLTNEVRMLEVQRAPLPRRTRPEQP